MWTGPTAAATRGKFVAQPFGLTLRVQRLGAELRRSLVPSAARVPSKSLDLVGGFTN
jgi:hypothetical protein